MIEDSKNHRFHYDIFEMYLMTLIRFFYTYV